MPTADRWLWLVPLWLAWAAWVNGAWPALLTALVLAAFLKAVLGSHR